MKRIDIIKQFKEDLETKFVKGTSYTTDLITVILGPVAFTQVDPKPGLWYWVLEDELDSQMLDDQPYRILNFRVVGYSDDEEVINYDNILNFAQDIEKFLMSEDWTYSSAPNKYQTVLGNISFAAGEVDQGHAQFSLNFSVHYYQDFD